MTSFIHFSKGFTIYSAVIGLVSAAIYYWVPIVPISPAYLLVLLFMYGLTMVLTHLLIKSMKNKLSRFVNAFMLLNFAKLIIYTILILVYAWLNRQGAISFILTFFAYYILFTVYEVVFLLNINK